MSVCSAGAACVSGICETGGSHLACSGDSCTTMPGPGLDTCNVSTLCSSTDGKHAVCKNGACTLVDGEGKNTCTVSPNNCPPAGTHLACEGNACKIVAGDEPNTCAADIDCASSSSSASSQTYCEKYCGSMTCDEGESCYYSTSDSGVSVQCFSGACPSSWSLSSCLANHLIPTGYSYMGCAGGGTSSSSLHKAASVCGNAKVEGTEECDSGTLNGAYSDSCTKDCTLPTGCGNGVVESEDGEECDNGRHNSTWPSAGMCRTDCKIAYCGNGIIEASIGEQCDKGGRNGMPGGTCNSSCQLPNCGDGVIQEGEMCDDPTQARLCGAGPCTCTPDCRIPYCGDGVLDQWVDKTVTPNRLNGEECDDGKQCNNGALCTKNSDCTDGSICVQRTGDGCNSSCQNESASCGDGICDASTTENCTNCASDCGVCTSKCGDAILELPEQCDDGNTQNDDGCSSTCKTEPGFHSECNAFDRCVVVPGADGRNECDALHPCGGEKHTVCDQDNAVCKTVDGKGKTNVSTLAIVQ